MVAQPAAPAACHHCEALFPPGSRYITVSGLAFHELCRRCAFCAEPVDLAEGAATVTEGGLFHSACASLARTHCRACRKPVLDHSFSFGSLIWHDACFLCGWCGAPMKGEIALMTGEFYHPDCVGPVVPDRGYFLPDGSIMFRPLAMVSFRPTRTLLCNYPHVSLHPHFLSASECAHLRTLAGRSLRRSETGITVEGVHGTGVEAGRTSQSAYMEKAQDAVVAAIEARVAAFVGTPVSHVAKLHVGHYEPGERFHVHFDASTRAISLAQTNGYTRLSTVLLYLNTPVCPAATGGPPTHEGCPSACNGHTQFPLLGLSVQPEEGGAVYFQNVDAALEPVPQAVHCAAAVCCGEKWVMNAWCYNKPLLDGVVPVTTLPDPRR